MTAEAEVDLNFDFETTEDIEVPDKLINQVIGQEKAVEIVKKAARQKRHVLMIGKPGTGKSMLAKAMTEILPNENIDDILVYPNEKNNNEPKIKTVPQGEGREIKDAYEERAEQRKKASTILGVIISLGILAYGFFTRRFLLAIIAAAVVFFVIRYFTKKNAGIEQGPNLLVDNSEIDKPRFEDATGSHTGALLGDVRHDPFQSGGMGTPAHQRVEAGAIHNSHRGVLFLDEIKTLKLKDQQKLLTALQEKEFSITGQSERSSGAMVSTDAVPCDFVLVAAGNQDAMEKMHPALRSRIKGYGYEIYFDDVIEDTPERRKEFVQFIAQEVEKEENVPHLTKEACEEIIKEARKMAGRKGHLTLELRELGGLVRSAGDVAKEKGKKQTELEDVIQAKQVAKSIEQQMSDKMLERKEDYNVSEVQGSQIGKVNGLAVMGDSAGSVLPIAAEVTPALGGNEGEVIATGKLQEIAQEAVKNVSAIIKRFTGEDINQKDVHIQFIQTYEGVEGDSASITIATAIISAIKKIPIKQDVAMTGSLTVRGEVTAIGGVSHKIEAAVKSGINTIIIPEQNKDDVVLEEEIKEKADIRPVSNIKEVLDIALKDNKEKKQILQDFSYTTT